MRIELRPREARFYFFLAAAQLHFINNHSFLWLLRPSAALRHTECNCDVGGGSPATLALAFTQLLSSASRCAVGFRLTATAQYPSRALRFIFRNGHQEKESLPCTSRVQGTKLLDPLLHDLHHDVLPIAIIGF